MIRTLLVIVLAITIPGTGRSEEVTATASSMTGVRGCTVEFEVYKPGQQITDTHVILAHGFRRDLSRMRGWAEHWSAMGIPVVIPSLCNSSWFKGRHDKNAEDLVALRRQLDIDSVLYAGFSAGGLAAYLAALDDPATRAYLGMDSVDSGDLAADSKHHLNAPVLFLVGESSSCNARQNFIQVIDKWEYEHRFLAGASHCHFEWPHDKRCDWVCGRKEDLEPEQSQAIIRQESTEWLLETLGSNKS